MYNLGLSERGRLLLDDVKAFLVDEVLPMEESYFALERPKSDPWSFAPG